MRWALLAASALAAADPRQFLDTYCVSCHGAATQMAQRRFDTLRLPPPDADSLILVRDIVDKMNLGAMPPPAAPRQPSASDKRAFVDALTRALTDANSNLASTGGRTVLRRLNRREYLNTVGDLFGINMLMFDPTTRFPRDQSVAHMDNIGDALVTSGYLLEQYLDAAEQVVAKAFPAAPPPAPRTWVFNSKFRQQPEIDYAHQDVHGMRYLCLYSTTKTVHEEGAYGPIYAFADGVPTDGLYEIKVQAETVNRKHPYDPKMFNMDPDAPFRLGVVPGNAKVGALHHSQPIEQLLGEVTLGDNGPEWHTFRVWLDAGYTPRFTFPNGINDSRLAFNKILTRYRHLLPPDQQNFTPGIRPARPHVLRYGKMPHIRIHEIRITGPLEGPKPRPRESLESLATRAYRRPVRREELERLEAVAARHGYEEAVKAILCSPSFLYMASPPDAHALATRLSYFLWSTAPDAELLGLARSGDLAKAEALRSQVRRMLADARSKAFVEGFLDSWLNLRALGDMPPDRDAFERYYAHDLQSAMRTETQLFARHLLDTNGNVGDFLDSSYTFVNKPLAALYGMDAGMSSVDGHRFRRVAITDPRRGGLLGQASVLTVSANGVETSPVTRGVWMLENIFGTPPAPPPDNVPPIDPDVRGAKSMREVLVKHRESPACQSCHDKIDPPGFALENFDPIGAWRTKYPNGAAVDASGKLEGGGEFRDVAGLRKLLASRKEAFATTLAERLLTYACGRRVERSDNDQVAAITRELASRGYGFRDLVELVVLSDMFRRR